VAEATPTRPNIVLVVLDSVRAANCSAYGYERSTTPHLERLAEQGALFEQATSVGCWTLPVHASLFTGMYPSRHGVTVSAEALSADVPTLAERLSLAGYRTACFSNNAYISSASGMTRGFEHVDDIWRVTHPRGVSLPRLSQRIKALERRGPFLRPLVGALRRAKRLRETWRAWRSSRDSGAGYTNARIRDWLNASEDERPFFIFVNYMETHEPYLPPYPFNRRFVSGRFNPWRVVRSAGRRDEILAQNGRRRSEDLEILEGLYDGTIAYADERVRELTDVLAEGAEPDATLVAVTSDHGDAFGEHGHLGHRLTLYEELLRVPLVIRFPRLFAPGSRVSTPASLGDLYPTIVEAAGLDVGDASDFRSLGGRIEPRPIIAENTGPKSIGGLESRTYRDGDMKLLWRADGKHELYDLRSDPTERRSLATDDPVATRALVERLEAWHQTMKEDRLASGDADYDEETLERLRGLGYVG
jgi:arylsulfatase A-like enzyme